MIQDEVVAEFQDPVMQDPTLFYGLSPAAVHVLTEVADHQDLVAPISAAAVIFVNKGKRIFEGDPRMREHLWFPADPSPPPLKRSKLSRQELVMGL